MTHGRRNGKGLLAALAAALLLAGSAARAERIETLVNILGAEPLTIQGKGVVTGLNGTGDKSAAALKLLKTYLVANNFNLDMTDLASKNIALVHIDAEIPPFKRPGERIPLRVTSVSDATNLQGGVLHGVNLRFRPDGPVVLRASGRVLNGTHPTSGSIPKGGQILRPLPVDVVRNDHTFTLNLKRSSWADASAIANAINSDDGTNPFLRAVRGFGSPDTDGSKQVAWPLDAGGVIVKIPETMLDRQVDYIQEVLKIDVAVARPARVLINRQTDTVIITGEVRVDPVAISHRNLSVTLPGVEAGAGQRTRFPAYRLDEGEERRLVELEGPGQLGNLQNLINTLNAMGVTTADVITIVEKLKASGALHAELIVE